VSGTFDKMIADCFVLYFADLLEGYEKFISKNGFQLKDFLATKDKESQKVGILIFDIISWSP
jgi:hypothetical protein